MSKILLLLLLPVIAFANPCDDLYDAREEGLAKSEAAFACYNTELTSVANRNAKAHALNQMSYLKFFMAELFLEEKTAALLEGIALSEKALLSFGAKYSIPEYKKLTPQEQKILAVSLYNYGLTTARYVDIKGTMEALKRMEDIKKSMATIIRIGQEATAHYGAHRTLGIFHTKVPAIAGGQINLAKEYLEKAIAGTIYSQGLSTYPANNIAYADYLFKQGKKAEACSQLSLVMKLTPEEVRSMNNQLYSETLKDISNATELSNSRKCSI